MKSLILATAFALGAPALAHAEAACADLARTSLPHAEVTSATEAKAGGKSACRLLVTSRKRLKN